MTTDKEWQEKLSEILLLVDKQHMEIAYLVPWCQLGKPPKQGELADCSNGLSLVVLISTQNMEIQRSGGGEGETTQI